jgi:hypothetical protein
MTEENVNTPVMPQEESDTELVKNYRQFTELELRRACEAAERD